MDGGIVFRKDIYLTVMVIWGQCGGHIAATRQILLSRVRHLTGQLVVLHRLKVNGYLQDYEFYMEKPS